MFVWVCELQTTKPEHGWKIKTDRFFVGKRYTSRASNDLSDGQEKSENLMSDFIKSLISAFSRWNLINLGVEILIRTESSINLSYNYTVRFIGYDSVQTR